MFPVPDNALPTDQFCSHCGEAVALDGADLPLSTAIAYASQLLVRGEIDQAIALLLPHAMATDADPRAGFALATAYLQRGRYADALPLLLEAVEGEPGNAHAHAYLAMAYLLTYQPADAREAMNRAIRLLLTTAWSTSNRANCSSVSATTASAF